MSAYFLIITIIATIVQPPRLKLSLELTEEQKKGNEEFEKQIPKVKSQGCLSEPQFENELVEVNINPPVMTEEKEQTKSENIFEGESNANTDDVKSKANTTHLSNRLVVNEPEEMIGHLTNQSKNPPLSNKKDCTEAMSIISALSRKQIEDLTVIQEEKELKKNMKSNNLTQNVIFFK